MSSCYIQSTVEWLYDKLLTTEELIHNCYKGAVMQTSFPALTRYSLTAVSVTPPALTSAASKGQCLLYQMIKLLYCTCGARGEDKQEVGHEVGLRGVSHGLLWRG